MTQWNSFPPELVIHILYQCDYQSVLRIRLTNKYHDEIIRSSSKLQYLIELGRSGLIPTQSQSAQSAVSLLKDLIQYRERWRSFILQSPRKVPPQDSEFNIYEFCGGILAHCAPGLSADTICYQRLHKQDDESRQGWRASLPFKCAEFSFDPTQDLLVVIEDSTPNFPIHILSVSTAMAHPSAEKSIFGDLVNTTSDVIDVETCISGDTVSFAYTLQEQRDKCPISVINWKTGEILLRVVAIGSTSASLLSSRYLMAVRCGSGVTLPGPTLDIYDLYHPYHPYREDVLPSGPYQIPVLMLRLPLLSLSSKYSYHSSYFVHGSNCSLDMDRGTGTSRSGETDIVAIVIRLSVWQIHDNTRNFRLLLIISRNRLIELARKDLSTFNSLALPWQPNVSIPSTLNLAARQAYDPRKVFDLITVEQSYNTWTEAGRYVRWLDGINIRHISKCATYGSRIACTVDPEHLGVQATQSQDGPAGHVCILEFNERLFGKETSIHEKGIVRVIEESSGLVLQLDVEARHGMPFRVTWFKKPSAKTWYDVMMDKDHLVARLLDGFDVYEI